MRETLTANIVQPCFFIQVYVKFHNYFRIDFISYCKWLRCFFPRSLPLWGWLQQGVGAWRCGSSLQSLPLCRCENLWMQCRSHASTSKFYLPAFDILDLFKFYVNLSDKAFLSTVSFSLLFLSSEVHKNTKIWTCLQPQQRGDHTGAGVSFWIDNWWAQS